MNIYIKIKKIAACLSILGILLPIPGHAAPFGNFGLEDEMKMGRQYEVLYKTYMPLLEDPEIKNYVQGIVNRIVATLPPQPYKFQANVILESRLNAFAAPGGYVFVHSGMLQHLEHESELAGVLAHEIAHVTQRHIARRIERGQVISLASMAAAILGALAGGGGDASVGAISAASAAGQTAHLTYSRGDESDADHFGMQYLVAAGYNPYGLSGAFNIIQEHSWQNLHPEYLSSHPDISNRLSAFSARIQSLPAQIRNRPQNDENFIRAQTLVWGRNGHLQHALHIFAQKAQNDPLRHLGFGLVYARQNKVLEAKAEFAKALDLAPSDPLVLREAGIFHYNLGDINLARQQLEQMLRMNPADYYARFFMARVQEDLGETTNALNNYRTVIQHVPEDAEVHQYYGYALGQNQQEFLGYLHLAYAALYANDKKRLELWANQAKLLAKTDREKAEWELFAERRAERAAVLDKITK